MNPCGDYCDMMAEAVYGDLSAANHQRFQAHLAQCPTCSNEYQDLSATIAYLDAHPEPTAKPPEVWDRLEGELDRIDARVRRRRLGTGLLAVAAVLLIWLLLPRPVDQAQPHLVEVPKPHPDVMLAEFLASSQPLLLAVANRTQPTGNMREEKRRAAELAQQAAELSTQLANLGAKRGRRALVADLQTLFLQMSNINRRDYNSGLELIRDHLNDRDILFRITLHDIRVQRIAAN